MKIAIIGAGLFGTNIATELSKLENIKLIDVYEKHHSLFCGASSNNQHRFHTGFHYPRSIKTIKQIKTTSESFKNKFSDCLFEIKNNIYFVAKNSNITFDEYYKIFSNNSSKVDLELFDSYFYINLLDGALKADEMCIDLSALKQNIYNKLDFQKINLLLSKPWEEKEAQKYDFIINSSYINPNLTTNKIKVKYEICDLILLQNPFNLTDYAFTVMDGPFSSLYPTENKDIYTLSNVEKTPFYKTNNLSDFEYALKNINSNFDLDKIDNDIIQNTKQFYKINNFYKIGRYISPKTKLLEDTNDVRTTEIIFEKKYITLLQGKISTIQYVAEKIKSHLIEASK